MEESCWHLCAHSRPLSPSSRSSLIVDGIEGSNAFRSTTLCPSPCSTPTLMLAPSPRRRNCTRRIAAPLSPRLCTSTACPRAITLLKMQKERRGSLICSCEKKRKWKQIVEVIPDPSTNAQSEDMDGSSTDFVWINMNNRLSLYISPLVDWWPVHGVVWLSLRWAPTQL